MHIIIILLLHANVQIATYRMANPMNRMGSIVVQSIKKR